jgi:hypothetical protein
LSGIWLLDTLAEIDGFDCLGRSACLIATPLRPPFFQIEGTVRHVGIEAADVVEIAEKVDMWSGQVLGGISSPIPACSTSSCIFGSLKMTRIGGLLGKLICGQGLHGAVQVPTAHY